MFDFHSHILPGFDDGARNGEIALAMLSTANRTGTRHMIATPHVMEGAWIPLWTDIVAGCRELQDTAIACNIDVRIFPGAEVALYPEILQRVIRPGPYCINGGRYMLIEMPPSVIPFYADEYLFALQLRGITPILAHPERHPEIRNDHSILERWISRGILVQINGTSLTGKFGDKAKITAESFLKRDMVHCIGSDAHNDLSRSPDLSLARKRIRELIGQRRAEEILFENPNCIKKSQELKTKNVGLPEWHVKKTMFSW